MAEELTKYLQRLDVKVKYIHSEVDTMERVEIIRDLRLGGFDVLVGVNLLRKDWTCLKFLWLPFWMLTKKGF